jgi:hypothetical protein
MHLGDVKSILCFTHVCQHSEKLWLFEWPSLTAVAETNNTDAYQREED